MPLSAAANTCGTGWGAEGSPKKPVGTAQETCTHWAIFVFAFLGCGRWAPVSSKARCAFWQHIAQHNTKFRKERKKERATISEAVHYTVLAAAVLSMPLRGIMRESCGAVVPDLRVNPTLLLPRKSLCSVRGCNSNHSPSKGLPSATFG